MLFRTLCNGEVFQSFNSANYHVVERTEYMCSMQLNSLQDGVSQSGVQVITVEVLALS